MIFPHHPETQGTASTPFSSAICVEFMVKGSLQEPSSPLDLQLTHLRRIPKNERKMRQLFFILFHLRNTMVDILYLLLKRKITGSLKIKY